MSDSGKEKLKKSFENLYINHPELLDSYKEVDEFEIPEYVSPKKKKKIRIPSVAVAAVCIIVLSTAIGASISSGSVDAVKDKVRDAIHKARGNEHLISDVEYSIEIKDLNDKEKMDIAYDLMPDLVVSETMFGDYKFDHMNVVKTKVFDNIEIYTDILYYDNENNELYTNQRTSNEEIGSNVFDVTYEERVGNGIIYVSEDYQGKKGLTSLNYLEARKDFLMVGNVKTEEMISYVKQNVVGKLKS